MDDTARVQQWIDHAFAIPPGTYWIDATTSLRLRANSMLDLGSVILKAIPTDQEKYKIIRIEDVSNVRIKHGSIFGERNSHQGKTGEWGMGIAIKNAKDITIEKTIVSECWGDGFYVDGCLNLTIDAVAAVGNRRQGISIITGKSIKITGSTFRDTKGARPENGIRIEPDKGSDGVAFVTITGCKLINNAGYGIGISGANAPISGITLANNSFNGNGRGTVGVWSVPSMWWHKYVSMFREVNDVKIA